MPDTYTDLLLRIFPLDERTQAYPVEAELDDGSRYTGGQLKLDRDALLSLQLDSEAYGLALFDALFAGDSRRAYDKATGAAEANTGGRLRVRLWVDNDAVELHAIAWERLYHLHKGKAVPLGASTLTPLSRYTSLEIREPQPVSDLPIQMLVAVSNPDNLPGGLAPANVDLEIESLRRSLDELRRAGQVKVTVMPGHTGLSAAVRSRLEGEGYTIVDGPLTLFHLAPHLMKSHIFHFIGHGAFRKTASGGQAALYLEKVDGSWQAVRDEEILNMLTALGNVPHLFFLVACESAKRDAEATSPFVGLGPKLVQAGVPAVVAMQEQVPVELARTLSSEFYARLAEHGEVDRALNQARLQVFNRKSTEWAIPVLFMRIRKGRLFGADVDEDAPAPGLPPFKGLEFFNENDADKFYGRELLTAKLVGRLRHARFLPVIIGASGSGKSSVIRAGLVPALRRGEPLADRTLPPEGARHWPVYTLTPSTKPAESLAASLTREATSVKATTTLLEDVRVDPQALHRHALKLMGEVPQAERLLIIVDQFEEIFTLCRDESERRAFINNLLYASDAATDGPTTVIIIFRADFYAHCAQYANLRVAVSTNQEFVGPMNREELRRSIEEPAKAGGWEFEAGLVDLILKEVGEEPGALPLMQHALLETWKRRRGRTMTLRGYNDVGGIRGAIAKTAEAIINDLSVDQQAIARKIFLRLVELGEGTQDTRRRAQLVELYPRADERPAVEMVLKKLVDNRLVVTTDKTAEVAHEALIREWPTLRQWINDSRDALRLHRELLAAAEDWEKVNRDEGALYRGVRLAQAHEWAKANAGEMATLEKDFLAASQEFSEREAREKEEQRQRELEAAQKIAEEQKRAAAAEKKRAEEQARAAERQRRLARVIAGVAVLAGIAAVVAVFLGFQSNRNAVRAENNAATAVFNEDLANQNAAQAASKARLAQARELAAQAQSNLNLDPELSLLLGLQSIRTVEQDGLALAESEDILHRALAAARVTLTLTGHQDQIGQAVYSPDGTRLATASDDGTAKVWDAATGQDLLTLSGREAAVSSIAFSLDGKLIVTGSEDATAKLWNAETGEEIRMLIGHEFEVWGVAFSPDGARLVTASGDATAKVWDVATGEELFALEGHAETVWKAVFSPDGKKIATASLDGTAIVWEAETGEALFTLEGHLSSVADVAFSPDGNTIATASEDLTARLWNAEDGAPGLTLVGHNDFVTGVAFNPDGTQLATASADATAKVWEVETGRVIYILAGHTKGLTKVAFSPEAAGNSLVTSSRDATAKVWDLTPERDQELPTAPIHIDQINRIAYSPDGQHFATASHDGTVVVWDAASGESQMTLTMDGPLPVFYDVAYSSDGQRLVAGGCDDAEREPCPVGQAVVWEASTGEVLATLTGHADSVSAVAFSPDGAKIATTSFDGTAKVWDATTGAELLMFTNAELFNRVAFSPDGKRLALSAYDATVTVWDAASGENLLSLEGYADYTTGLSFSPDGRQLAGASFDGTVKIWDMATGDELRSLVGHSGGVYDVAYSPDGTRLLTGSFDKTAILWDAATGRRLITLTGHTADVSSVAFSPDARSEQFATASYDTTVRRYVLPIDDLMALAQARLTRTFSAEECEKYLPGVACPGN